MSAISRRSMLQGALAGAALASASPTTWAQDKPADSTTPMPRKGRIKQSVCRWEYPKMTVDELCAYAASIGLKGVDLLQPTEWEIPHKYGIICTMGYAEGGSIKDGLNRVENHDKIVAGLSKNIPIAAKMGVPNVITFSGNRMGMSDEEGAKNTVIGLNRLKKVAEDNKVVLVLELLNSKVNHKDYMADHTAWGVEVMKQVGSPNIKLLYDIYHMQIMEGDLIATIQANIDYIGHFHTGGVPGRHDLDGTQEVQWDGVMRGIAATNYQGYVAHEYSPKGDPKASLLQAANLCDV
ncbi:hydroxypyruvate isomerase family protein [Granulicella sibirica]|uniref:Hydroxypyruvate isomerase n=1 Tax=Granulicella sibirica TaxID=2479048 RepID=A0A4Q0SYE3_9BACT|nr:TIM barrel protein [Granulicella sibirica]RXH54648.1 Hydroxypyruvate isomerase [Granulicella sibirica]